MLYTGLDLPDLKRFTPRFGPSSGVRFIFVDIDLSLMNAGTETPCVAALETKYSKIRAVGLYFRTENLESAAEMPFLSSSRSKAPSANVMGFHLSFAWARIASSKSVICAVMHLLTLCSSTALRSGTCAIRRKILIRGAKELHHSYILIPGALECLRMSIHYDELITAFLDKVLLEEVKSVLCRVRLQLEPCEIC